MIREWITRMGILMMIRVLEGSIAWSWHLNRFVLLIVVAFVIFHLYDSYPTWIHRFDFHILKFLDAGRRQMNNTCFSYFCI